MTRIVDASALSFLAVSREDVQTVRAFFAKRQPQDRLIAAFVGQVCGMDMLRTLKALLCLVESGEVAAHEDRGLSWTFSRRAGFSYQEVSA